MTDGSISEVKIGSAFNNIDGGISYLWKSSDDEIIVASLSLLYTASGLNGSIALVDGVRDVPKHHYFKIGLISVWFQSGSTAISLDYSAGSDLEMIGSDSNSYAFAVVQKINHMNLEIYGTVRRFQADLP